MLKRKKKHLKEGIRLQELLLVRVIPFGSHNWSQGPHAEYNFFVFNITKRHM